MVNRLNSWTETVTTTIRSRANSAAHNRPGVTCSKDQEGPVRIYHDEQWWRTQLPKLETSFFKALA